MPCSTSFFDSQCYQDGSRDTNFLARIHSDSLCRGLFDLQLARDVHILADLRLLLRLKLCQVVELVLKGLWLHAHSTTFICSFVHTAAVD
jgi:hypothetical protein